MRVIGSLTTIPSRIINIKNTLLSLHTQSHKLDNIYLNIPYKSTKENHSYIIPDGYSDICEIIRCPDYHQMTKLYGALYQEDDPNTIIITFDDDTIYPEGLVEKLLTKYQYNSDSVVGSAGIKLGSFPFYINTISNEYKIKNKWYNSSCSLDGEDVDIIMSYPGTLYVRKFFPEKSQLDLFFEKSMRINNADIFISAYLCNMNIPRVVYKLPYVERKKHITIQYIFKYIQALSFITKKKLFKTRVNYIKQKTITYPFILILFAIILFSTLISIRK